MAGRLRPLNDIRRVLLSRSFSEQQIEKVLPNLQDEYLEHPNFLAEIIDTWNNLMSGAGYVSEQNEKMDILPKVAQPPKTSPIMGGVDMNTVLAELEPDLLRFEPQKLIKRHEQILNLGIIFNLSELWTILFNAPRGFYLQDWSALETKLLYIESNVLDLLYDKKELEQKPHHPIIKNAAVVETNLDHIRTRYLFALRSGYKALSHMYPIQSALQRPNIGDFILSDNSTYLKRFTPFCSMEEYNAFSHLIKKHDIDDDDTEVFEKLAELNALKHS